MPTRVYMNRRTGEERIHVELTRAEIREMLARPAGPASRAFWGLVATADHQFSGVTLEDPVRSNRETSAPRCVCGDPIERWTGPGDPGWIHSPGSDTPCLDPQPPARRRLTESEHDRAWHAIEGAAGKEGADPGTVLNAVLRALDIDAPAQQPEPRRPFDPAEGLRRIAQEASGQTGATQPADTLPQLLAATLAERFTALGNPFSRMSINFKGPDGWPASRDVSPNDVADVLRELIGQASAPAGALNAPWPSRERWRVETYDPVANEWAPGSPMATRGEALARLTQAEKVAPRWRDGTPVRRRIVRETTTYTAEEAGA